MRLMRVLVVDDAASVRQRLLATFRKADGVEEVAEAASGEEALEVLETFKPSLVTLDLMLPGMSGLEVLEELRVRAPEVKVVVFTNYPYPAFRRRCLALGASQFFGKSTDVERILELAQAEGSPGNGSRPQPQV
jgi:DNA-binding NarL/FixJ family response regulator